MQQEQQVPPPPMLEEGDVSWYSTQDGLEKLHLRGVGTKHFWHVSPTPRKRNMQNNDFPKVSALQHWWSVAVSKYAHRTPEQKHKSAMKRNPVCHQLIAAAGILAFLGILLLCMDDSSKKPSVEVRLRSGSNSEGQCFLTDYGSGSDNDDSAIDVVRHGVGGELLEDEPIKQSLYARRLGERQALKIQSIV